MIIVYDSSGKPVKATAPGDPDRGLRRVRHIAGCDEQHAEFMGCLLPLEPAPPAEPDTDWLMAWASGWLAGYATGYEHGHEDGEREYGESLAEALTPMRRAAAHGIDVALAREAWGEHQRRKRGGATA